MTERRSIVRRLIVTLSLALVTTGLAVGAGDTNAKIESTMKKVNKDNVKLRRFSKFTSTKLKTQGAAAAAVANEMASLVGSVQNNTHYIEEAKKKGAANPETTWKTSNRAVIGHLKDYAAAAEKHDAPAVKKAFSATQKACDRCHDVFRPEEESD